MITDKELEKIGFHCESDDGYESIWRFNNLLLCGNDIDGYIIDHSNKKAKTILSILEAYHEVHKSHLIIQVYFKSEIEMKWFLIENNNIELADGYGRSWMCKGGKFYFRDLGQIKYKEGWLCGHLYKDAKIPTIYLSKNRHKEMLNAKIKDEQKRETFKKQ